jgi:hypothetical protein
LLQLEEVYRRTFWFQEICEQRVTQDTRLTRIVKGIAKIVADIGSASVQIAEADVAEIRRNREHIKTVPGVVRLAAVQNIAQREHEEWPNG